VPQFGILPKEEEEESEDIYEMIFKADVDGDS